MLMEKFIKGLMKFKLTRIIISIVFLIPGCTWFKEKRETLLDRKVSIPKELILDIPEVPPLCDEIPDLKKGFIDIPDGKLY